MPISKDASGDPQGSMDSADSVRPFALALEKLREATRSFERARRRSAKEDLARARNTVHPSARQEHDTDVDAIRRALLVEMFRKDVSRRSPRR